MTTPHKPGGMMMFSRTVLSMALLSSLSLSAHALSVESVTLTGGTFRLIDSNGGLASTVALAAGPASQIDDGLANGVIDADGEHGSTADPVVTMTLLFTPVFAFFAHSVATPDWAADPTGNTLMTIYDPDPDPISMSGTPWDPVITADFSGFFMDFSGNKLLQGGIATGTGTWVVPPQGGGSGVFDFELSWSAPLAPPFGGHTGEWTVTGTAVAVVPEADTYAMLLAGLAVVGGAARRRTG